MEKLNSDLTFSQINKFVVIQIEIPVGFYKNLTNWF